MKRAYQVMLCMFTGGGTVCFPGGGTVCITRGGCVCAPGPIFPGSTIGGGGATDDTDSDDDGSPVIFPGGGLVIDPISEGACESCCIPGPSSGCCITGPLDPTDPSRRDVCIDDGSSDSSDSDDDYDGGGILFQGMTEVLLLRLQRR